MYCDVYHAVQTLVPAIGAFVGAAAAAGAVFGVIGGAIFAAKQLHQDFKRLRGYRE